MTKFSIEFANILFEYVNYIKNNFQLIWTVYKPIKSELMGFYFILNDLFNIISVKENGENTLCSLMIKILNSIFY